MSQGNEVSEFLVYTLPFCVYRFAIKTVYVYVLIIRKYGSDQNIKTFCN